MIFYENLPNAEHGQALPGFKVRYRPRELVEYRVGPGKWDKPTKQVFYDFTVYIAEAWFP